MTRRKVSIFFLIMATTIGCTSIPDDLEPVTGFEADRYLGTWYEIARLDHSFERHLSNVSATYSRGENGKILVLNKSYSAKTGKWKQVEGRARFLGSDTVGSLKVSFFGPFYGGYHIIELDRQSYQYSMVTGPSRSYLWILSRSKTLDENIYSKLISKAGQLGFDTTELIRVQHDLPEKGVEQMSDQITTNHPEITGRLQPCPKSPNCVSSVDTGEGHFIQPLEFVGNARDAQHRLLGILNNFKGVRVVTFEEHFIQAEFISSVFQFVDDVEFVLDDRRKIFHVRSASRVGFYDFGVNRRRIEKIRNQFAQDDGNYS